MQSFTNPQASTYLANKGGWLMIFKVDPPALVGDLKKLTGQKVLIDGRETWVDGVETYATLDSATTDRVGLLVEIG